MTEKTGRRNYREEFIQKMGREPNPIEEKDLNEKIIKATVGTLPFNFEAELEKIASGEKAKKQEKVSEEKPLTKEEEKLLTEEELLKYKEAKDKKALGDRFTEEAKAHETKLERDAKEQEKIEKTEKDIARWAAEFANETPRQREIRTKLYEYTARWENNGQKAPKSVEKERDLLRQEYGNTPYQMGERIFVKKTVVFYECKSLGVKIVPHGSGFKIEGIGATDMEQFKESPIVLVDPKSGIPIGYTFNIHSMAIYDFKRGSQIAQFNAKIVEEEK